jgi:hypothetical protein
MHYYLTDLCYYSTLLLIYHVHFEPTSEAMLRMTFLFSNGCLAVSIMAFRNQLVIHDLDCLTSMVIHAVPMIITHHVRFYLIPLEENLPVEQRKFATISKNLDWPSYLHLQLWNPLKFYFLWLALYAFV